MASPAIARLRSLRTKVVICERLPVMRLTGRPRLGAAGSEADRIRAKENDEHNKQTENFKTQIRNLQRDLERKSANERGNPAEIDMLAALQAAFAKTDDRITAKSGRGGDATQIVRNKNRDCGKVVYESKDTKNWVAAHVTKLLEDRRDAEAEHAVLCVATLRDDMPDGQLVHETDGVFVVKHENVVTLARMVRDFMVKLATAQITSAERANMHHKFYELITSESGQHALRVVPESIESLRDIDAKQLNYTKERNKERQKIYEAQQTAFEPFTAAIDAILSGDSQ
jgi:hypothetical protein